MEQKINLETLRSIRDGSGHSVFGPSGSSMWLNCAGSLIPNLLLPDNGNPDSAYGTVAHGVTETWLKTGKRPTHLVGTNEFVEAGDWGHLIWIDDEMLGYAEQCIDWCEFLPGTRYIERRVDFSRITPIPRQTGTADMIIVNGDTMYVIDWKFGKGLRVYAENNTQGMLYALGALWEFDPERKTKKVIIRIGQPRLDHFDEWEVSVEDLLIFAGVAKAGMKQAWQLNAPRVAGAKQCQFCKINRSCAAAAKLMVELTEGAFEDLDHPVSTEEMREFKERLDDPMDEFNLEALDIATLSTAHLAKLKPFHRLADKWWKSLEAELYYRAADGESLEPYGLKVVEGRAYRKFTSERAAAEQLSFLGLNDDQVYERKFTTPSKAEALLIKAGYKRKEIPSLLTGYTIKPQGKPTIVPLSDKRSALVDLSEVAFGDLDSETSEEEEN